MKLIEDLAAVARVAVGLASDLVRTTSPRQVIEKGDRDTVTDIDVKVEHEVRSYLHRVTPECAFLGEEEGQIGENEYVWTLDPIDGTSNFVHGLPLCAVSLALVRNGRPVVAEINAPFLNLNYSAIEGRGSFANGNRMRASGASELSKAIVSIGDYAVGVNAEAKNELRLQLTTLLAERVERVRMFGSAALDLAWVAEGRTDGAVILANKPWDTAAGVLIAREAGAEVRDRSGESHTFQSSETIAACPGIVDVLVALVRRLQPH